MSNLSDFIIENGVLKKYVGPGGDVVIPEGVTEIFSVPFCDFPEPFTLTLSGSMKCSFGDLLSQNMTALTIPAGTVFDCSYEGPNHTAFYSLLKEIRVDPANPYCASKDGILYSKDMTILYVCPAAHEGKVVIPDTVTKIGSHAFDSCVGLKEIVIPASVEEIGERAFVDCKALSKLTLLGTDTRIGAEAFLRCGKLTSAGLVGTQKGKGYSYEFSWEDALPENAFSGMNKLKTVVLPESVKMIGKNVFKGCKALEQINLPVDVKYDKKAFKDCAKLSL